MKYFVPLPRLRRASEAPRAATTSSGQSTDTVGRGMDMAITLAAFLVLGWLLDRWLGTAPVFLIVLVVISSIGQFLRMKYSYDAEMERLEAERLAARRAAPARRQLGDAA
jgi:F0F1-type ATP synthase assembly protein I